MGLGDREKSRSTKLQRERNPCLDPSSLLLTVGCFTFTIIPPPFFPRPSFLPTNLYPSLTLTLQDIDFTTGTSLRDF